SRRALSDSPPGLPGALPQRSARRLGRRAMSVRRGRLARLASMALIAGAWACSAAELDVLDPGASRDAGVDSGDASLVEASGDSGGDSGPVESSSGSDAGDASGKADAGAGVGCEGTAATCNIA